MPIGLDALRKSYAMLIPFERVNLLLLEATITKREDILNALVAKTYDDAVKGTFIYSSFYAVASVAIIQSLRAARRSEKLFAIALCFLAMGKDFEDKFEIALQKAIQALNEVELWITALAKLEERTGAELLAMGRALDQEHVDSMLARDRTRPCPLDNSEQFDALREVWEMLKDLHGRSI